MPSDVTRTMQQNLEEITSLLMSETPQAVKTAKNGESVPPVDPRTALRAGIPGLPDLPRLSAPAGPLSLDSLMRAIGDGVRKNAVRQGIESLEAKGREQEKLGREQLEKMKEQMEKLEKQKHLSFWKKAFSVIAIAAGAIASAATLAIGVATANPLLIAGGALAMAMTIDAILEMATDGKIGLMAGVSKIAQACNASESTAMWIAFATQMALTIVSAGCSIGGMARAGEKMGEMALRFTDKILIATRVGNVASGVTSVGQGALGTASSAIGYQSAKLGASQRELAAILEQVRQAFQADKALVELEAKLSSDLLEDVATIVKNCNATQRTILGANPAMA